MPSKQDGDSLLGRRVTVDHNKATVLYVGPVGATKGEWLGVEWDDPARGRHDGTHEGVKYFHPIRSGSCCSFLRHNKVSFGIDVVEGVNLRYGRVEGDTAGVELNVMEDLQKEIGARFVQVKICYWCPMPILRLPLVTLIIFSFPPLLL